jgi:hypothetical protein
MDMKSEGVVFPPVPLTTEPVRDSARRKARAGDWGEPRCEMCGSAVIATQCKRICLRCGFMTGCSEGI